MTARGKPRRKKSESAVPRTVLEIADRLHARVIGNGNARLMGISSIATASDGDLVFAEQGRDLDLALASRATAVIAGDFAAQTKASKPLLIAANPRLAFTRAARLLDAARSPKPGIRRSAVVASSARLGKRIVIAERAVVGENATIGDGSWIGAGCVIGTGVSIGRDCRLSPNVTVYPNVRLGDRVMVHAGAVLGSDGFGYVRDPASGRYEQFPQIGRLEIEDDVEIGANATIDRGALDATRIGRGAKLDNLVHVGHNCQIGENVVIAAQTGLSGSVVIEDNAVLAGQVGIGEHARIEAGVIVGAQAGAPSNKVLRGKGIIFWGTPARPITQYLKGLAALSRLAKKEK